MALVLVERGEKLKDIDSVLSLLKETKRRLDEARPTAVNLSWATSRMTEFATVYIKNLGKQQFNIHNMKQVLVMHIYNGLHISVYLCFLLFIKVVIT